VTVCSMIEISVHSAAIHRTASSQLSSNSRLLYEKPAKSIPYLPLVGNPPDPDLDVSVLLTVTLASSKSNQTQVHVLSTANCFLSRTSLLIWNRAGYRSLEAKHPLICLKNSKSAVCLVYALYLPFIQLFMHPMFPSPERYQYS
jgi:hypothetical protein